MASNNKTVTVAVLDDYQNAALRLADWSVLDGRAVVTVFNDHLADTDAVVERLKDFEVLCVMRERTPLPRATLERLPKAQADRVDRRAQRGHRRDGGRRARHRGGVHRLHLGAHHRDDLGADPRRQRATSSPRTWRSGAVPGSRAWAWAWPARRSACWASGAWAARSRRWARSWA